MLTSKRRAAALVHMFCPAGRLVPRPPTGVARPKWRRFYNWPRDESGKPVEDYPGGPVGDEVVVLVPKDHFHGRLIARGSARLATAAEIKALHSATDGPKEKADTKTKKKDGGEK